MRSLSFHLIGLLVVVAVSFGGCSDDNGSGGGDAGDDTAVDAGGDVDSGDTGTDPDPGDTGSDSGEDVDPGDTGTDPDPDATPDTTPDVDAGVDTDDDPDAGGDTDATPDADAETDADATADVDVDADAGSDADVAADADAGADTDIDGGMVELCPDGDPMPMWPDDLSDDTLDPLDGAWSDRYITAGAQGDIGATVYDSAWDEDGNFFIAGTFSRVADVPAPGLAMWDGTTWSTVGEGLGTTEVDAIAFGPDGTLYIAGTVGGGFTGGVKQLLSYDGTEWTSLGDSFDGFSRVYELSWVDGQLWIGGNFAQVGDVMEPVAAWNGTAFESVTGTGIEDGDAGGEIRSIVERDNGDICIGGSFSVVNDVAAERVACLVEGTWTAFDGLDSIVHALFEMSDGQLVAGGNLSGGVAYWDSDEWITLGEGVAGGSVTEVRAFAENAAGELYVGGAFAGADDVAAQNIAVYDGLDWYDLGGGVVNRAGISLFPGIYTLSIGPDADLYAGGLFSQAGELTAINIARWAEDDAEWFNVADLTKQYFGAAGFVNDFTSYGDTLYVGGSFTSLADVESVNVAAYSGGSWESLGTGIDGGVQTVAVGADGTLFAGGRFTEVGVSLASYLAWYDGTNWLALDEQLDAPVQDLASCPCGELVVTGEFTSAGEELLGGIGIWEDGEWSPMLALADGWATFEPQGTAVTCTDGGTIYTLAGFVPDGGDESVTYLAAWDGSSWAPVGSAIDGTAFTLESYGEDVYVGGRITIDETIEGIARWSDGAWSQLGDGLRTEFEFSPPTISGIAIKENGLFAIGNFNFSGDTPMQFVAWFDTSTWHALDEGLNDLGEAAYVFDESLFIGGPFTQAGTLPAYGLGEWEYAEE